MPHLSLGEIAAYIGGVVQDGEATMRISGVKPLEEAGEEDITVIVRRTDVSAFARSRAAAAVTPQNVASIGKPLIRVRDPRLALALLLERFYARPRQVRGVDPRAVVAPGVRLGRDVNVAAGAYVAAGVEIGDRVDLYPGVYLGEGVRVGDDSVLFANVSVYPGTVIGKRVRLHSGAVIGSDGFGYCRAPSGGYYKIPQVGRVEIEDDVEIGANSTVDRATMTVTRIGAGTKIDNLVQVAHNVHIGRQVCIVGQSGIAGSVHIGDGAVLGAGAGLVDHITVGTGARIAARAGVDKDVPAAETVAGTPSIPIRLFLRAYSLIPRLPEYRRKIKALEERCARLEAQLQVKGRDAE